MDQSISAIVVSLVVSLLTSLLTVFFVLGKYKEKVDTLEKCQDKNEEKQDDLMTRMAKLEGGIDRDRAHTPSLYTEAHSPLALNDKGKALLLDSGGKTYIDSNLEELVEAIKG